MVLISGDRKTQKEIKALLPKGAAMEGFATPDELPQPLTPSAEGKYTDTILLVDLSGGPVPARKLEPFRLAGIPLLALIRCPFPDALSISKTASSVLP